METRTQLHEPVEILPEHIGTLSPIEAAPLLERASLRIQTLGWKGEFWNGVKENLEGASAWIKAEKTGVVKKTLSAVVGISFLTTTISACSNGPGIVATPFETGPVAIEVSSTDIRIVTTETQTPANTPIPTETSTPTESPLPLLSENPTADELFAAKEGQIPEKFNFGGHVWTEGVNAKGEKVWTREDGKIDLEWASLYGGGHYNAYMFVSRSKPEQGKRTLEIYTDPRYPVFYIISGSPDAVDVFVGTTVTNFAKGKDAQAALRQPGSNLKIIIGGIEYWPLAGATNYLTRQDLYYIGPNGETLTQKVWGAKIDVPNGQEGLIGPFVESSTNNAQCANFFNEKDFADAVNIFHGDPSTFDVNSVLAAVIGQCFYYDPEQTKIVGWKTFDNAPIKPLITSEIINLN